jgi:hypothetical protein
MLLNINSRMISLDIMSLRNGTWLDVQGANLRFFRTDPLSSSNSRIALRIYPFASSYLLFSVLGFNPFSINSLENLCIIRTARLLIKNELSVLGINPFTSNLLVSLRTFWIYCFIASFLALNVMGVNLSYNMSDHSFRRVLNVIIAIR